MARKLALSGWLALACLPAFAQPSGPPAVVGTRCALCHGEKGESASDEFARLAGQHEAYLAKQLRDFKAGLREGPMVRMARSLSEDDIVAIARFYAAQPVPPPSSGRSELAAVGRYIHLHGNRWSGVPACKVCHGEAAHGSAMLPRLASQNADYLERQIREFSQRRRTNDNEVMHTVAEKLTPQETRAVAEYLAGLP